MISSQLEAEWSFFNQQFNQCQQTFQLHPITGSIWFNYVVQVHVGTFSEVPCDSPCSDRQSRPCLPSMSPDYLSSAWGWDLGFHPKKHNYAQLSPLDIAGYVKYRDFLLATWDKLWPKDWFHSELQVVQIMCKSKRIRHPSPSPCCKSSRAGSGDWKSWWSSKPPRFGMENESENG